MIDTKNTAPELPAFSDLLETYQLKRIPRSGWLQSGIPAAAVESVASHTFGMLLLALWLRKDLLAQGLDFGKVLEMAALHDLAESKVGDITPRDQVSPAKKRQLEQTAFEELTRNLSGSEALQVLWEEFETGETREAQLVRRLDKLDMLIQAFIYEREFHIRLDSFWQGMDALFKGSESESIYRYMILSRDELEGN